MNIRESHAVAILKKAQDEDQARGEAAAKLIEESKVPPPKKEEPPPGSTVSVVA
jgi:hypothetical protein